MATCEVDLRGLGVARASVSTPRITSHYESTAHRLPVLAEGLNPISRTIQTTLRTPAAYTSDGFVSAFPRRAMAPKRDDLPTPDDILAVHAEIEEQYDLKFTGAYSSVPQVRLRELLAEAEDVDGVYCRAAFLLRKLITEHVFRDGNKRTAWIVTLEYLESNAVQPSETGDRVPHILRRIRRYELDEVARWLESGDIDENRLHP